eukprot:CAMPEP_0197864122 /NCGR_PEP_ID=MMETSP1438-20131217/42105_1 /TAXON_ID=1461541 /ORGANISM="Pterosperma sp., Strain CCMP1384" /LENGTH=49 /DNA_ID= /DNA_START= /DNA_END= /DNA_ORIENTATION=
MGQSGRFGSERTNDCCILLRASKSDDLKFATVAAVSLGCGFPAPSTQPG